MTGKAHFVCTVVFLVTALVQSAFGDLVAFSDDFSTDTTFSYTWFEEGNGGDDNPLNNYTYDPLNKWVTIRTADNNNIYMGALLPYAIQTGYFQMSFMPWQTYPTDGVVQMRLYAPGGQSFRYEWDFAHNSDLPYAGDNDQYRARLEKWVGSTPVVYEVFIPSPSHYDLGQWHTLAMRFDPWAITGYLDGQAIITRTDPTATPLAVNSFEIVFKQQDQHLDDILVTEPSVIPGPVPPEPIPAPGAALLGAIGLLYSGWRLRRRTL